MNQSKPLVKLLLEKIGFFPFFLLFTLLPLVSSNNILDQGLLSRFLFLQAVLFLLLVLFFNAKKTFRIPWSIFIIVFFAFVAFTGIGLFWGNTYSDSVFEWVKILSYFLLLVLLLKLYSFEEKKNYLPLAFSILGFVLTIFGLVELFDVLNNGKLSIPLDTYQVKTWFGHRNLFLQVLFITFPFQIYSVLIIKKSRFKWVYGIFVALSLFLIIVLSNRAVWLSIILGLLSLILINILLIRKKTAGTAFGLIELKSIIIIFFSAFIIALIFFKTASISNEAGEHLGNIAKFEQGSGKDRIGLWKRSLKLIGENPVLGCGAANWKIEMLKYGNRGLVSEDDITFYQRPHNDFLWIFSEYGIFGGVLYVLLFLLAFWRLIKLILSSKNKKETLFFQAVFYALTGFLIFSFLSFPHERIVHNVFLMGLFSSLFINNAKETKRRNILNNIIYIGLALIIFASAYLAYSRYISEAHTKNALFARIENSPLTVISEIEKAQSPFYEMDPLSTPLSWYKGMAYYKLDKMDSAMNCFYQALQLNPYHVHALNNLASVLVRNGETEKAIEIYQKTLRIYPDFEEASLNLCAVYYNSEEIDMALKTLTNINPNNTNPNYKTFVKTVLKSKISQLLKKHNKEDDIKLLPSDEDWYFEIIKQLNSGQKSIEKIIFEQLENSKKTPTKSN